MYEDYFGLERPPFKITPDTSLFYDGGKRGDILAALVYAIHRGEGIIKVVGEVGSGKTMLCRMLQLRLPDTVEIVYIANPSVSAEDILFVIAHELSLQVTKQASKHEVMHMLQDYLLQRHMENKQVVLFIEEAQGMPLDTLEEVRLLSNLETDENKLLQIILFGQPELDRNLSEQSIRQLRERITHNFELAALTQDEIHNYLNFRMREVGYTGPELISTAVAKKVEQHSEGLLRRINIIGDKILLSAFAEGTHNLTSKHVTAAVNDSAFNQEAPRSKSRIFWWLGLLAVIALLFALYQSHSHWMATLAVDLMPKQENAVKNDNPITDIAPQAIETSPDKAQGDTATDSGLEPTIEQPAAAAEVIQVEVATRQENGTLTQQDDAVVQPKGVAVQQDDAVSRCRKKSK
jgi:type II secretory pathway predicted ATPase ExeA